MRTIIKNAVIIDGTGKKRFAGEVFIEDEQITEVGTCVSDKESDNVIDARGLTLVPGFIDTHSHSDLKVLVEPELLPKLHQGITTEVLGQDGISMAPLPLTYVDDWKKNLAGLDGEDESVDYSYETTDGYLKMVENVAPALNESYLLPHGNVRMEAMGLENRSATKEEIKTMCLIVEREMKAGCLGLSSGLIYIPCTYGKTEELIEMCKVVKKYDGVFVVHQRSEADDILNSMDEIIRIGRESGVKIHFSHFKVCGKPNWNKLDAMMKKLDDARNEGITVTLDQYPYTAGSTMLSVILPPWVHAGGTNELIKRLRDEKIREKIKEDIKTGLPDFDNFIDFAGVDGIYITSVVTSKNQDVVGLNLEELGKMKDKDPIDAVCDLLIEEENAVGMVDFYGTEDHVKRILQYPETNVCTDGLLAGKPHPRVYGAFPRVLGKYVREEHLMSLEEAVHKMTEKPATSLGIKKRGIIKKGYFADLVLMNPDTVMDQGTFTEPMQYPIGIEMVMVNGKVALENGHATGVRAGKVIRRETE